MPGAAAAELGEAWERERRLGEEERDHLRCRCGAWLRPHVLWFDESYDEGLFRYSSTMKAIERAAALVVIGTSGATTLPARMCERAASRGIPFLVLDPEETVFAQMARSSPRGGSLRGAATQLVPEVVARICGG